MKARHAYVLFAVLMAVHAVTSVLAGRHLAYDGAYFFIRILQRGSFATPDTFRNAHHVLVHGPLVLAVRSGITDWQVLSLLFGVCVFGIPLAIVSWATWKLLQGGQAGLALLMVSIHALSMNFTGLFIISESHLALASFFLALAILRCDDLRSRRSQALLVAIGLSAVLCYEFWAAFALVCIALLLLRTLREKVAFRANPGLVAVMVVYMAAFAVNVVAIIVTTHAPNRDAMISSSFVNLHYIVSVVALSAALGAIALGAVPKMPLARTSAGMRMRGLAGWAAWLSLPAGMLLGWIAFDDIAALWGVYTLRSLNLFLPLVFAAIVFTSVLRPAMAPPEQFGWLVSWLTALIVGAQLRHTNEWVSFKNNVASRLEEQRGYVSSEGLVSLDRRYSGWWTDPAFSIVVQAMRGRAFKSILYNPRATWQPFGPPICESPRILGVRYGFETDSQLSPDAPACERVEP